MLAVYIRSMVSYIWQLNIFIKKKVLGQCDFRLLKSPCAAFLGDLDQAYLLVYLCRLHSGQDPVNTHSTIL